MAKRRKVGNLLALAILSALVERPMHPYEIASVLRERGKDYSIKIRWGSLYTVVGNLEKHGFVEATETTRSGRRPERTVYRITQAGRDEAMDWLRELLSVPEREFPRIEAALSEVGVLPPDEVVALLQQRIQALDADVAEQRAALERVSTEIPRLFLIEVEYHLAMCEAELTWLRSWHKELVDGSMPGLRDWRAFHETGEMTPELAELARRGATGD